MTSPEPKQDAEEPAARQHKKLTAFDLFFEDPAHAAKEIEDALVEHRLLTSLPEHAPRLQGVAARYLLAQVGGQILTLLQHLPLGDMLAGGWEQLQKVGQAKTATKLDGSSRNVSLFTHEVTFTHSPTIEMLVNEVPIPLLQLMLEATFAIDACELVITAGEIVQHTPGPSGVRAALKSNGVTLLEHPMAKVDPRRLFTDESETASDEEVEGAGEVVGDGKRDRAGGTATNHGPNHGTTAERTHG